MSATKILWGQVITVFLIVLAAVWGATQWTAAALIRWTAAVLMISTAGTSAMSRAALSKLALLP